MSYINVKKEIYLLTFKIKVYIKIMKHNIYPLGETPTADETGGASFNERFYSQTLNAGSEKFKAVATGEFRPPRKGEWYLSGAIVTAYKAANDLGMSFHIAKLAKVEKIITETVKIIDLTH